MKIFKTTLLVLATLGFLAIPEVGAMKNALTFGKNYGMRLNKTKIVKYDKKSLKKYEKLFEQTKSPEQKYNLYLKTIGEFFPDIEEKYANPYFNALEIAYYKTQPNGLEILKEKLAKQIKQKDVNATQAFEFEAPLEEQPSESAQKQIQPEVNIVFEEMQTETNLPALSKKTSDIVDTEKIINAEFTEKPASSWWQKAKIAVTTALVGIGSYLGYKKYQEKTKSGNEAQEEAQSDLIKAIEENEETPPLTENISIKVPVEDTTLMYPTPEERAQAEKEAEAYKAQTRQSNLFQAIKNNDLQTVELLLKEGADPLKKNPEDNLTPLDIARDMEDIYRDKGDLENSYKTLKILNLLYDYRN